jgi:hypothetical protein
MDHTRVPPDGKVDSLGTLMPEQMAAQLPGCAALIERLRGVLHSRRPPTLACSHVLDNAPVALACAGHPAATLSCWKCAPHHLRRHSHDFEFTCDECASHGGDRAASRARCSWAGSASAPTVGVLREKQLRDGDRL